MEDKQLSGQNQQYNPNQTYHQNPAYNPGQTSAQNQAYNQGQPYTPPPAKAVVYDTMPMKNNNAAIAGLIFGIFALLGCWLPFWNLLLSIVGIVCSAIGTTPKGSNSKMAIAGLVISIIALLLAIIFTMVYFVALML